MAQQRPSAAAALYPHLKGEGPPAQQQQRTQSLAAALYPALAEKTEAEARERNRQTILPDLPGTKRRP